MLCGTSLMMPFAHSQGPRPPAWLFLAVALCLPLRASVVIHEIHYHPVEEAAFGPAGEPVMDLSEDVHEFVELHNSGEAPVDLSGWRLAGGIEFVFPSGAIIEAGGYRVVARTPARLEAIAAYGLPAGSVLGPWTGVLRNTGDTVRLQSPGGGPVDEVQYEAGFPWPNTPDAMGADQEWTGIDPSTRQYRGRSLERVSAAAPSDDPANWVASPLAGNPSPGRVNAASQAAPRPVVVALSCVQRTDGQRILRAGEDIRVEVAFSAADGVASPQLEWFVENVDATNEVVTRVVMSPVGIGTGRYLADIPGRTNRSLVRYRIRADRGAGDEVVSPRSDDAQPWHACFVTPVRAVTASAATYDIFISRASLTRLQTNISANPRRITSTAASGRIRASWNATEPCFFVHDGTVYEARMRHHGSQYRRDVGRRSYKVQFPEYRLFRGSDSVFLTDKDFRTANGQMLFRAGGLPTSMTRGIDLYMNNDARLARLEQGEFDKGMLEEHHAWQAQAAGTDVVEPAGEIYKSQGVLNVGGNAFATSAGEGPYGSGSGMILRARTTGVVTNWTSLGRYGETYSLQNHGWVGHVPFERMINGMWAARSNTVSLNSASPQIPGMRAWLSNTWNIDDALTHIAMANWMVFWDDTAHNSFLWRHADGRWSMLPWDFDTVMDSQPTSGSIFDGAPFAGPNYFKQTVVLAFRDRFRQRAWELNNTLLHPESLTALKVNNTIVSWARTRLNSVNSQVGLGVYYRPGRPVGDPGTRLGPSALLRSTPYTHDHTNGPRAHVASVWEIRASQGDWVRPLWRDRRTDGTLINTILPWERLVLGQVYAWRVTYEDADGHFSLPSREVVFSMEPAVGDPLRLSEILADNAGVVRNGSGTPDYVELENTGSSPLDLSAYGLTDEFAIPGKFRFPAGTFLPAGGRFLLWCDRRFADPGLHSGFGLGATGDRLALFRFDGDAPTMVDVVEFGLQIPQLSIGRLSIGNDAWTLGTATPLAVNAAQSLGDALHVRINEWMAAPTTGDDWFELFNPEPLPVALSGMAWSDNPANPMLSPVRPLSFVAGRGLVQFRADLNLSAGADHVAFRMRSSGGGIFLHRASGARIDGVVYGRQVRGVSEGRVPDGGALVARLTLGSSPATTNGGDFDGDGVPDAWASIHRLPPITTTGRDWDGDGVTDRREYLQGTSPTDGGDAVALSADWVASGEGFVPSLRYRQPAGRSLRLERWVDPSLGTWLTVESYGSDAVARDRSFRLDGAEDAGLFRLVVE